MWILLSPVGACKSIFHERGAGWLTSMFHFPQLSFNPTAKLNTGFPAA